MSADKCIHYDAQQKILNAMDEADVIILASPVYVYHVTAPMKNFLDHQGHRWMIHRPVPSMFKKQGVCISTAAGAGMKRTNQDMADSLYYWGVGKIYKYGVAVRVVNWSKVKEERKQKIDKQLDRMARKIKKNYGRVKPSLKTRLFFFFMRTVHLKVGWSEPDMKYWNEMGWTGDVRPWK